MKYTLEELAHLRQIRLLGFKANEECDDVHTNSHASFGYETKIFLDWLSKMERLDKIEELLSSMG